LLPPEQIIANLQKIVFTIDSESHENQKKEGNQIPSNAIIYRISCSAILYHLDSVLAHTSQCTSQKAARSQYHLMVEEAQ